MNFEDPTKPDDKTQTPEEAQEAGLPTGDISPEEINALADELGIEMLPDEELKEAV